MAKLNYAFLTPQEATQLAFVQAKLRQSSSAYQHDRLIEAIAKITNLYRWRMKNGSPVPTPENSR